MDLEVRIMCERYAKHISGLLAKNWEDMKFTYAPAPTVEITYGPRYARIVKVDASGSRSVHTFVDLTNGNILKGNWKAPVKNGVRGNLLREGWQSAIDHHGAVYLR